MNLIGGFALLVVVLIGGCASNAPDTGEQPPRGPAGVVLEAPPYPNFETAQRDRAARLTQQENWSEVAVQWEILILLRPDNLEYKTRLREAKSKITDGVRGFLRNAGEAREHGDTSQATANYLKALRLDPTNLIAIDGLRSIDQESHRRSLRTHVTRTATQKDSASNHSAAAPSTADTRTSKDVEFAVMLLHQGDYADGIKTLEKYLKGSPKDEAAHRYLADAHFLLAQQLSARGKYEEALAHMEHAGGTREEDADQLKATIDNLRKRLGEEYYEKGLKVYRSDLAKAIDYWERCLQYDPRHEKASARLQQARQMQKNLRTIENGTSPQ